MAIGVTALVMTLLSFGPYIMVAGHRVDLPSLYRPLMDLPVVTGALPTRFSLALLPLFGALLGYGIQHALRHRVSWVRMGVPVAVAAALLPIAPRQLATIHRDPVPEFISSGHWRDCTPEGGVLVPVPLPTPVAPEPMRWAAVAGDRFALPEGFFLGPYGPGGRTSFGTWAQPTSKLLAAVALTGVVPHVTDANRRQAAADLTFWNADCVVVADGPHAAALRATVDSLLKDGRQVDDVWVWDV